MQIKRIIYPLLLTVVAAFAMTSCSEDDGIVEEFPDWQLRNETYFNNLTDSVQRLISSGRTDWKRIRTWSKGEGDYLSNSDYIIVHVLENAPSSETVTPIYTDSIAAHYKVWTIPSTSYRDGKVFDSSYKEPFDKDLAVAARFYVGGGLIDGFTTAVQNMRRGDVWEVYIPYQLGYGTEPKDDIPGYSTLIYKIMLIDHWSE